MKRSAWLLVAALLGVSAQTGLEAYPLDGYAETGIRRLEGSRMAHEGLIEDVHQPPGSLWSVDQVRLRLIGQEATLPPPPEPGFAAAVRGILGDQADRYSLLVLDLTNPLEPAYAEHRPDERQNVGSVGKVLAAHGLFQALADAWPEDLQRRRAVLRDTIVVADEMAISDHHRIRLFDLENRTLIRRPIQPDDRGSLWEYLDWMLSLSSNAAASMVMREAMLLRQFGPAYPLPEEEIRQIFAATPAAELTRLFQTTFWAPVKGAGLDSDTLRQGSFFTQGGQRAVSGGGLSHATARALLDWLVLMERGRIVDPWSSLELKRLLYVTERRIRYASSPALQHAAVYSKSGSLFSCRPEPGFKCLPYHGNVRNYMNSINVIEEDVGAVRLYYIVVLLSNVLRENSAVTHQSMATRIHRLIRARHGLTEDRAQ